MTQWLELSRQAVRHNLQTLTTLLSNMQCWPCLKANAYGHGMEEIAQQIEDMVHGFMVVSTGEALRLRACTSKPIMVLNIVEKEHLVACSQANIILPLASDDQRAWYESVCVPLQVHLEYDSGMARTGYRWNSVDEMLDLVTTLPSHIDVTGLFSHYAAAGEDHAYTREQYERFVPFAQALKRWKKNIMIHVDKSSSALLENYHYSPHVANAFRPGIAVYGFDPQWGVGDRLQPVLTWKTHILSLRTLKKGEKVGYGLTFTADKDTQIATLPIGYADGYDRSLSNRASVLVRGHRCPVRGRICMNLTMIEVPPSVQIDDEVTLIGRQSDEYISAAELGAWADSTMYEIVTRLNSEIKRVVV